MNISPRDWAWTTHSWQGNNEEPPSYPTKLHPLTTALGNDSLRKDDTNEVSRWPIRIVIDYRSSQKTVFFFAYSGFLSIGTQQPIRRSIRLLIIESYKVRWRNVVFVRLTSYAWFVASFSLRNYIIINYKHFHYCFSKQIVLTGISV